MNRKEIERAVSPCPYPIGTKERIETYRLRVAMGLDTQQPGDSKAIKPPANHSDWWRRHHTGQQRTSGLRCFDVVVTPGYFELKQTNPP